MTALTIGMATYDDFHGVFFSLHALRLYQDLDDVEILVIDNYGCEHTQRFVEGFGGRYLLDSSVVGTAAPKDLIFREAAGAAVLCMDSHVLLAAGAIERLKRYYRDHPESNDLLQGPLINDDLEVSTHFDPVWRGQMWGTWATDPRGRDPEGEPFEIPMQGMGLFSCRRVAWPGFNPLFRGFGGEEGYIHEKFRQAGGRCLCLPWLRWIHRFVRPAGVPYPLSVEDKLRNYIIGCVELGLPVTEVLSHFAEHLPGDRLVDVTAEALWGRGSGDVGASELSGDQRQAVASATSGQRDGRVLDYPPVSCICPTYGRPDLLEESIESFLRQDYPGEKELIVLNDLDRQQLHFDHPEVTVVNLPRRIRTLGEKHNAAVALARHDVLFVWDDDDIYLPHRLRFSVEHLDPTRQFFKPKRAWFWNDGKLSGPEENLFAAGSCWSRDLFQRARTYAPMGLGHDAEMEERFEEIARGTTEPYDIAPADIYYIYRWAGTGAYHVSGLAGDQYQAVAAAVEERIRLGHLRTGEITLAPHWQADYEQLVKAHLAD